MSSPGFVRGIRKGLRTVAQVAAGGALTALVTAVGGGLAPSTQALVMGAWIAFVAFSQNWLEGAGRVPVLLPTPSLVPLAATPGVLVAPVVATVEAVADELGQVTGTVAEVGGGVVGRVTGLVHNIAGAVHLKKRDEEGSAGKTALLVIGFVVAVIVGGFTVCDWSINDESEPGDRHFLGRVELVDHDYDDGGYYDDGEGQWNSDQRNHNRRNRGAFSPGPFTDSPVDFSNSCISLDCSGRDDKRNKKGTDE